MLPAEVTAALALIRPGTRLVSICTGAFILAAAGLLDGRPATTHWKFADAMRRLHPEVLVDENVLFVDDGDVLTSAGLAAGIDLCLHIIRRDHGAQVANAVARYCVVPPWREGGQAQFIDRQVPTPDHYSTAPTREWALGHLDESLTVQRLAAHAKMSARTFNRRFREETGESPGAWIREPTRRPRARTPGVPRSAHRRGRPAFGPRQRRQPTASPAPRHGHVPVELPQGLPGRLTPSDAARTFRTSSNFRRILDR